MTTQDLKKSQQFDFEQFRNWLKTEAAAARIGSPFDIDDSIWNRAHRFSYSFSIGREFWGCEVTLTVRSHDEIQGGSKVATEISSSGTSRNIAQALTLANNLRAAVDFASRIQAFVGDRYLVQANPTSEE